MKATLRHIAAVAIAMTSLTAAADVAETATDSITPRRPIISRVRNAGEDNLERIVEGGDTVDILVPKYTIGRYDRGLFNYLFIPKGNWEFDLTASYGEFSSEDVEMLSILKDFDFSGKLYSISPSVSYFIRNNQSVGMRFSYRRGTADLGSLAIDFDDDMNFAIKDVSYYSQAYTLSAFYRNYIGLSSLKRFGIFNEIELSFSNGTSRFKRNIGGEPRDTRSVTTSAGLNFSPGVTVFVMDFISFNVSFGVFGLHMSKESQTTNGVDEGSRFTSGANFKFNLFNIKFGISVNI